ncbi:hypothetical protein Tco_1299327, partial [Tanacetum coccineum]
FAVGGIWIDLLSVLIPTGSSGSKLFEWVQKRKTFWKGSFTLLGGAFGVTEIISFEELGVKDVLPPYLDPNLQIEDLLTGVNFASGGGGYDHLTSELAVLISLEGQLELFKEYIEKVKSVAGEEVANTILSKGLFVVATGSNDVTNTYFNNPLRKYHFDFDSYASLMVNSASSFLQVTLQTYWLIRCHDTAGFNKSYCK